MTAVFSTRFIAAINASSATYVVPAGKTAVIRSVTFHNLGTGPQDSDLVVPNIGYVYGVRALAANGYAYADLRQVVNSGETIQMLVASGVITCFVSGYLLSSS